MHFCELSLYCGKIFSLLWFYVKKIWSFLYGLLKSYADKKDDSNCWFNVVSDSVITLPFLFSQIERIDQLFAGGGLRHLMFYYQDVEVAETGI